MNNRFNAKTNVLFLSAILIAGTFAAISPLSFIIGVEAQSETEYGYNNSYGPIPEYQDNNNYNKLKDSSVSIEKIKCNNININFLGNNTGDINLGNKDGVAAADTEGYSGAYSSDDERYNDEYNNDKNNIGFVCTINNNNTNVGGNQTLSPEPSTCEECFTANLNEAQLENLTDVLSSRFDIADLKGLCEFLSNSTILNQQKLLTLIVVFNTAGIPQDTILRIAECLEELGLITLPPQGLPSMR